MLRFLILLCFVAFTDAYTVFNVSCTTPNSTTNFVNGPDSRGTLDILWSCLFTIVACTWTIQHLNIPKQRNGRDPGWKGDTKWQLIRLWTNLKWMLLTMLAPELLLAKAWQDLTVALSDLPLLQRFARIDEVEWTVTHSLFADMGGFVIRGNTGREPEVLEKTDIGLHATATSIPATGAEDTLNPGEEDIESQYLQKLPKTSGKEPSADSQLPKIPHHDPFHLTAAGILHLRSSRLLPNLPSLTVDEINDKSKSDSFSRIVAVIQITWIAVQVIARAARGLSVSQLEITVVAFSACAIIIYALDWKKPKGVDVPYTLLSYPGEIPTEIIRGVLLEGTNELLMKPMLPVLFDLKDTTDSSVRLYGSPIPNDTGASRDFEEEDPWYNLLGLVLGSLIFGGIHCAAWDFMFPSSIERLLWRISSLYCVVYMFLFLLTFLVFATINWARRWCLRVTGFLYVLARLFLLVDMFRALCFLPPDAYTSTWASNIPHVG